MKLTNLIAEAVEAVIVNAEENHDGHLHSNDIAAVVCQVLPNPWWDICPNCREPGHVHAAPRKDLWHIWCSNCQHEPPQFYKSKAEAIGMWLLLAHKDSEVKPIS